MANLKRFRPVCIALCIYTLCFFFSSCGNKSDDPGSATIKFTKSKITYGEDSGAINIEATLSAAQSENVVVAYSWASSDTTTYLGGDFSFLTPTSFIISKGQTTGNLQIQIIDDTQIDADDSITFTLTGVSGGSVKLGAATETKFDLVITNNDTAPTDALQIDLVWHTTTATENINECNLDLYLQYNVNYTNTSIIDQGSTLASSENKTGWETLRLKSSDPDQKYFIEFDFTSLSKSGTALIYLTGFNKKVYGFKKFKPTDAGYSVWYGPLTKSGSSISGRQSVEEPKFYLVPRSRVKG